MEVKIRKPDDMHLHLRQGPRMRQYAGDSAACFARGVIMPNIVPPVISSESLLEYKTKIQSSVRGFTPIMTFQIVPDMTEEELILLKEAGAAAGKLYPAGVTTNSEDGISDIDSISSVFSIMERLGIILSIHGENPSSASLEREKDFLPVLESIVGEFPGLKIVFEHVSSKEGVEAVIRLPDNVSATITAHHLFLTLESVIGDKLEPHNFCKPVPKTAEDLQILRETVFSGNRKFFFGSDSAPHAKEKKESSHGAAGIYSAPVAVQMLAGLFEEHCIIDKLENFTSRFGAEFYSLPLNKQSIRLVKEDWMIPPSYHGIVPFFAGRKLHWKLG